MKKILVVATALTPFLTLAQTTIQNIITTVRDIASSLIPLFMIFAVAVFLWGIVKYVTAAGDEEKAKSAKGYIIYGLIGIFVMIAFWGIIEIVTQTFDIRPGGTMEAPYFVPGGGRGGIRGSPYP
jgi:fumarate reductase subunit D